MAKIKRIGVLKMAYFAGLSGLIIGIIFAIVMGVFYLLFYKVSNVVYSDFGNVSLGFTWLNLFLFPLMYGVGGFLGGLIITPLYNLILKIINGLELDIEMGQ